MAFFASAIDTLKILVIALGAGLVAWGVVNLLEGYGNDNPGAKSQGIKQLMAGGEGVPDTDVCRYEVHACAGVGMRRVSAGALGRISSAGTGWRLRWGYIFHGSCNRCFKRAA